VVLGQVDALGVKFTTVNTSERSSKIVLELT
jgi:hypothetical protein